MKKVTLLIGLMLTMLATNIWAQEDGTYYLYNEESGLFYSRASSWGTAAVGDNYGFPVNLAFTDGATKIAGADWTDRGLGVDLYYDQEALNWTFTPSGNGYVISDANGKLKVNGEKVQLSREQQGSVWKLITKDDYEQKISARSESAQRQAIVSAGFANLEGAKLTDVTDKVQSAALINSLNGWTTEFGRGNNLTCNDLVTESYESTGKLTQKVTGLEKGLYKVTLNSFFRNGWNDACVAREATGYVYSTSYVRANGSLTRIKTWASERVSDSNPNSMAEASEAIAQGKYLNEVYCYVGDNGELDLEIGWPSFNYGGWFICKNLKLYKVEGEKGGSITGTPVPDGYYYIRLNCDAYDLAKPYITDGGAGTMALNESNATSVSIWQIISHDASDGEGGKKYEIVNAKTKNKWVAGPNAPLGTSVSSYNILWNKEQNAFNFSGRSDGNIGNAGYVCANSATVFGRNSGSAYCNWELIPAEYETVQVTFQYTFNGEVVKTQTQDVEKGAACPTPSAPFKCSVDTSGLPETVNSNIILDVPVTTNEDFPFAFSKGYDDAKWYTWKMRSGYAGFDGTYFPETASETQPTAAKDMFAFVGNPFAFKVLTPTGKYVYLKGSNNEKATATEDGASFYVYGMNSTEYTFAIDGVTGTVNDVQKSVGFWANNASYNDGGSKIYLNKVDGVEIYKVAFGADCPAGAAVTINGVTITPETVVPAFVLTGAPKAEDITTAEVKYFKTEVAVTGKTINVSYITNMPTEWVSLGKLVAQAKAISLPTENFGTDPGFYNKAAVEAFPAAVTAAEAAYQNYELEAEDYAAASTALTAAIAAIQPLMPEVGKVYMFINAFPTFEAQQGHKKAIYSDGTALRWKQKDDTDKSFYWTVTAVDGNKVTFQNYNDGKYPTGYNTMNQPIPVQEAENYCMLTSLGQGQFNIVANGTTNDHKAFHAGNHGGGSGVQGNVMIWNAGANTCSAWYIHETTDIMALVDVVDGVVKNAKETNTVAEEFITSATPTKLEWTTSTEQFSSNRPCPAEGNIDNLLDGDPTTFFHSDWSGTFPAGAYHEFYVDGLDENVTKYDISFMRRSGAANDHVLQMEVYGGTVVKPEDRNKEAAEFTITSGETPLAILDTPKDDNLTVNVALDLGETGYEALCFRVTNTVLWNEASRAYFHFGDFHMYDQNRVVPADVDVPTSFRVRLAAKVEALEALLAAPQLSEEYAALVQEAKEAVDEAFQQALANVNANRKFAGNNKAQLSITAGVKGNKGRASVEMPEEAIKAALGVASLDEAKRVAIDGTAGYMVGKAKYVTETGYRDAEGKICESKDAALQIQLNGGKFYVTPKEALDVTTPNINIYTVYTANDKAFLFLVTVNVVPADGEGATAINALNANVEAAGVIYDLQGRKVSSVKAGQIYIVDGKKIMLK